MSDEKDWQDVPVEDNDGWTDVPTEGPVFSQTESFGRGARDATALGFGDELAGLVGSKLEKEGVPGLLPFPLNMVSTETYNKILPDSMQLPISSTQQDEAMKLADPNIQLPANANYESIRNQDRLESKQAEKQNPNAYLAGGLTAGLATAPLMGAANTVKGAAGLGAGIGAASGLGNSEAETAKGMLADTAVGATLGAGIGAVAQAAPKSTLLGALGGGTIGASMAEDGQELHGALQGAGIGTVVGGGLGLLSGAAPAVMNKMGGTIARNYNYAKETGINVFNPENTSALAKQYQELVAKVKAPFLKQQEKIQSTIKSSEQQLDNLGQLAEEHSALDKQYQLSVNNQDKQELAQQELKLASDLQNGYGKVLTGIKKNYDRIENQIPKDMIFDISDEILSFKENALHSGGLPAENIRNFFNTKKFREYDFQNMTAPQIKKFREEMQALKPSQGTMSSVVSDLIEGVNVRRASTLDSNPATAALSQDLRGNDRQYSRAMRLQDNYINDINVNKSTGQVFGQKGEDTVNSKTLDTIKSYLDSKDPKKIETANKFLRDLTEFDPELAQNFQNQMTDYVAKGTAVNNFTPAVQAPAEIMSQNPDAVRLQELLSSLKKPENVSLAEKIPFGKDADAVDKPIRDKLQKMNDVKEAGSDSEYINSILAEYKKMTGEDITPEAKKAVEGYVLSGNTDIDVPNVSPNALNQAIGIANTAGGRLAGGYGRMERALEAGKLGYINQKLSEATAKGKPALDAARFDLLQQPAFREMLKKRDLGNKEEEQK